MVKKVTSRKAAAKRKLSVASEPIEGEHNVFEDPEASADPTSSHGLKTIASNEDVELPAGDEAERDERAEEMRDRLKKVFEAQAGENFAVARDLAYLSNQRSYTAWGYKTFESFVDKEFKLAKRNAEYHVRTHNYLETSLRSVLVDDHSAYNRLVSAVHIAGWTKAKTLAQEHVVNPENVEEVIVKLDELSTRDFEAYCVSTRKLARDKTPIGDEEDQTPRNRRSFLLTDAQESDMKRAMEHMQAKMTGKPKPSSIVTNIMRDYLSTNTAAEGKGRIKSLIEDFVRNEGLYGVEIVVRDSETKKMIHGASHLEAWASDGEGDGDAS